MTKQGATPLHLSASIGNDDILKLLIERVKDAPLKNGKKVYNLMDGDGNTPLFVGDKNVQLVMLYSELDNLELTQPDGTTLLWSLTKEKYDSVYPGIISSLRSQVNQRVEYRDQLTGELVSRTPVFAAEHSRIVRTYLEAAKSHDIHLDTIMDDGYTLLHHCVKKNEVTPFILKELEHQRHMKYRGMTPVLYADDYSKEAVEMYIRRLEMETSEQIAIYEHCLEKRMLSHIMSKTLCPVLTDKNTRKLVRNL